MQPCLSNYLIIRHSIPLSLIKSHCWCQKEHPAFLPCSENVLISTSAHPSPQTNAQRCYKDRLVGNYITAVMSFISSTADNLVQHWDLLKFTGTDITPNYQMFSVAILTINMYKSFSITAVNRSAKPTDYDSGTIGSRSWQWRGMWSVSWSLRSSGLLSCRSRSWWWPGTTKLPLCHWSGNIT